MNRSLITTALFIAGVAAFAPVYWFGTALGSMGGGPEDDIVIIFILAVPILLHGFIVAKHGLKNAMLSSTIFFLFVAGLCVMRHFDIESRSGYNRWHAFRSLESLAWSVPWFAGSLLFVPCRNKNRKTRKANKSEQATPDQPPD